MSWKDRFERPLVSWWVGGITSVAILGAGVAASLRPTPPASDDAWRLLLISLVGIAAVLAFARQSAVDRAARRVQGKLEASQSSLQSAAQSLPDLIRTSPEKEFLWQLGVKFEKCLLVADEAGDDPDYLRQALTHCLLAVAELARDFDSTSNQHLYCANLMVFLQGDQASTWGPCLKFAPAGPASLHGVLALSTVFSGNSNGNTPDPNVAEFALPVPKELGTARAEGGDGWNALPGAPLGFVRKDIELFSDVAVWRDWFDKFGNFNQTVKNEVIGYFTSKVDSIRGFLAIPIYVPSAKFSESKERVGLGVVNVHWSKSERLANIDAARLFCNALSPLLTLTARTLVRYQEAGGVIAPNTPKL